METENLSLLVYRDGNIVFSSVKKWLHPLFDLETFLKQAGIDGASLVVEDKIVGRGAAFLVVRLGIRKVHARLLSERGRLVFEHYGIEHTWDELVERIQCMTEDLLEKVVDVEEAYAILKERANRAARNRS